MAQNINFHDIIDRLNALVNLNLVGEEGEEEERVDVNDFDVNIHDNLIFPLINLLQNNPLNPAEVLEMVGNCLIALEEEEWNVDEFVEAFPHQGNEKWNEIHDILITVRDRIQQGNAGNAMNMEGGRRRRSRRGRSRKCSRRSRKCSRRSRKRRSTKKNSY